MASISPRTSGLPMTVWVSPRGNARREARVKVCRIPGTRMVPEDTPAVSSRPQPLLWEGELDAEALAAVQRRIALHREVLPAFRDGTLDSLELAQQLRRL